MNERIKQLSDIAYENYLARNPNSSFGRRTDYDKEFAELIVRECVRYFNEDYQRDFETLWREDLSKGIKQHFGVEE